LCPRGPPPSVLATLPRIPLASALCHHAQHDAQLDYYGKKLATCSSDRTVRIYDVQEGTGVRVQVAELKGHEGPVWQCAWAHPQFGVLLASCSYDRKVCVWKEQAPNQWVRVYLYEGCDLSANCIAWAPAEFGLVLAVASADTTVSILTHQADDSWTASKIDAHQIGVNSVSWAPAYEPGALVASAVAGGGGAPAPSSARIVTGGCDNLVKVWRHDPDTQSWSHEATLSEHADWVRDVAWAPVVSSPAAVVASCSQDGVVLIWSRDAVSGQWSKTALPKFETAVWKVSWSLTGGILAVSTGDNKVRHRARRARRRGPQGWQWDGPARPSGLRGSDSRGPVPLADVCTLRCVASRRAALRCVDLHRAQVSLWQESLMGDATSPQGKWTQIGSVHDGQAVQG
jgi:protein transport protein SEC13